MILVRRIWNFLMRAMNCTDKNRDGSIAAISLQICSAITILLAIFAHGGALQAFGLAIEVRHGL
jgi:hypothetical protein